MQVDFFWTFLVSARFHIRSMLFWGVLFLMLYILKITYKYFVGAVGRPIFRVIIGLMFILVAYLAIYLNRKYLGANSSGEGNGSATV